MTASNGKSRAHTFLVVSSLTTVFLFSGTVFGWGALSSMLQRDARRNGRLQEGYYDWLCDAPDPNHPCEQQLQALNNAFTLATTFVSLTAFANGWLVDTFGPMKVTILAGAMSCVGLMGIALTRAIPGTKSEAEQGFDVFLWSLLLVAVGGSMTMFIGYQAPFVIPSHFTLLIEVNSCLFDAGTIIFPILKLLYDAGNSGYSLYAVSWAMNMKDLNDIRAAASGDTDLAGSSAAAPERQRPLEQRGMLSQMASWEFAAIFIYSIIQVPRANMYMGSVELVNRKMAEAEGIGKDTVAGVSTITGFIIPFGFLAVPLIELCVHRLGTIPTVQVTTLLGVVYNLMQLIPKLYLQLATVCVFAAWRAFLYSTISAFNGETFGVKTMGRIMGLCFVFSGLTNMITGPLVNAAVDSQNFTALLVEALCVCIPLPIIFQLLQWKRSRESHPARTPLTRSRAPSSLTAGTPQHKDILDPMGGRDHRGHGHHDEHGRDLSDLRRCVEGTSLKPLTMSYRPTASLVESGGMWRVELPHYALMLLATPTIPPMARQPLTHLLPDYVVLDVEETRAKGAGGYLAAGFWSHDWQRLPSAYERCWRGAGTTTVSGSFNPE
eukprot:g1211.t1